MTINGRLEGSAGATAVVTVNGTPHPIGDQDTVESMATRLMGPVRTGVAIAVNGTVLPAGQWSRHALADGDEIEMLTALQGG